MPSNGLAATASQVTEGWVVWNHKGPYVRTMGRYVRIPDGGEVFKHEKLAAYLYFQPEDGRWAISNIIGASRCWMFAQLQDSEGKVEQVKSWQYLDPESRKWKPDEHMISETWSRVSFRKPHRNSQGRRESAPVGAAMIPGLPALVTPRNEKCVRKDNAKSLERKEQLARLKRSEKAVRSLINENKTLMEQRQDAEAEKSRLLQNFPEEKERLEKENKGLESQISSLESKIEKLETETEEHEVLQMFVQGMQDSIQILEKQLEDIHKRSRKADQRMLSLTSAAHAEKEGQDPDDDDDLEPLHDAMNSRTPLGGSGESI